MIITFFILNWLYGTAFMVWYWTRDLDLNAKVLIFSALTGWLNWPVMVLGFLVGKFLNLLPDKILIRRRS